MKVAEALAERADLDKRLAVLSQRITAVARYVEGEEPAEDAGEIITSMRLAASRREELVTRINLTNAQTVLDDLTVTAAMARRERLQAERKFLAETADAASPGHDPYGIRGRRRAELPEKTDLPVRELRAEADRLARQYRELDLRIQESNWVTELL